MRQGVRLSEDGKGEGTYTTATVLVNCDVCRMLGRWDASPTALNGR